MARYRELRIFMLIFSWIEGIGGLEDFQGVVLHNDWCRLSSARFLK
jgi:hypothetical protein